MIKQIFGAVPVLGWCWFWEGFRVAAGGTLPLATLDYNIVGIGLQAGPEYQAVPERGSRPW